jgi:hypothetical protein
MKAVKYLLALGLTITLSSAAPAAVLLDDDWDDGDRTDTNLPEEAAWYGSTVAGAPTLSASPGALTGHVQLGENASSRLWISHFRPSGSPVELAVGDTLKGTLVFTASNVTASSSSQALRIGLFNFSEPGAAQVTADGFSTGSGGGAPGTNVTGYMLNMNFGQTLSSSPLRIYKRTDLATNNLLGALAVFTPLGSAGGGSTGPGFRSGIPYTFELMLKRLETGLEISVRFTDNDGWSITHTATDTSSLNVRFDGFALRPNNVVDTAHSFTFTRFKVEHVPYELRIRSLELIPPFNDALLTFETLRDKTYQVEWRANLSPTSGWNPLGGPITGNGEVATVQDQDAGFERERYYRVVQLQ